ncbi:MAG: phosphoglycerate dehydrogenase [Nitrososphaeria archaeon]|jgi:D-3-phosphoglycerate dehydrogenase
MSKPIVLDFTSGTSSDYYSENFRNKYEIRQNPFKRAVNKEEEMISIIRNVDATIAASEPYSKEVYEAAKKLKIVARYGVGYDSVDVKEATKFGVFVTNLPGVNSETVAEHTVALIFSVTRNIVKTASSTKPDTWQNVSSEYYSTGTPFELYGKTLGIVGFGAIGSKVARICSGLNMKIIVSDPYPNLQKIKEAEAELVSLERALKESDVITVHSPLNDETRHMIGEKEFKMMKKTAIFINAARGPIVDERALFKALKEKWISAAGLDVLEKEPPERGNPLFTLDNVIITPHVASSSIENSIRTDAMIEEQIEQALEGKVPKFALNPEAIKYRK